MALLQGPSSYFFDLVGDALIERGAETLRICFCVGDRLFWRRKPSLFYRGAVEAWPQALAEILAARGVTDLLMLGDSRPRHRLAIDVARAARVAPHIVEHGYFRPDWLTHEIGGMAARSPFGAAWASGAAARPTLQEAEAMRAPDAALYRSSFRDYAAMDVAYNLSNVATNWIAAPRYAGHSNISPLREYAGWLRKLVVAPSRARQAEARLAPVLADPRPLFLWALQLETDFQIRDAEGGSQRALIAPLIAAFAAAAPSGARLVVKAHPLDNTLTPWRPSITRAAADHSLEARVIFVEGGDLEALLARAAGVVTVNSSVGFRALAVGAPTYCLGEALYDAPGLTASAERAAAIAERLAGLRAFFASPRAPDETEALAFLAALRRETQFRGAFDGEGAAPGAAALADRILGAARPDYSSG
ncbi:MAG: capsular biosynthesis protein [Pseudomonadota bacterium]